MTGRDSYSLLDLIGGRRLPAGGRIIFRRQTITLLQLHKAALRLAHALRDAGISPGQPVGVIMERSPDCIAVMLGLWNLGAVYLPVDHHQPMVRLEAMLSRGGVSMVICDTGLARTLRHLDCRIISLAPITYNSALAADLTSFSLLQAARCAYIIHTSGSTGHPKGVAVSHASLENVLQGVISRLDLQADDIFIGLASFSFDISFFELLVPLMLGATLVLPDEDTYRDPGQVRQYILQHNISVIQATPSLWSLLMRQKWPGMPTPRLAISTGESLSALLARQILTLVPELWNLYGPTEATIWATAYRVTRETPPDIEDPLPIGRPLNGYECLLDTSENDHGSGELLIGGVGLALEYHNQPGQTSASFPVLEKRGIKSRWYRSGDRCAANHAGELVCLGRLDDQLKISGYRIEPREIELILERHNCIQQALVGAVQGTGNQPPILAAWIVYRPGMPNKTVKTIQAYLRQYLPDYLLVQRCFFVDSLPLNSNGKVDRKLLLNSPLSGVPNDHTECRGIHEQVTGLFCRVLEVQEIGPFDSFFDNGGSSMLAATLLMLLNETFHTSLTLKQLLQTPPTPDRVCRLIEQHPEIE